MKEIYNVLSVKENCRSYLGNKLFLHKLIHPSHPLFERSRFVIYEFWNYTSFIFSPIFVPLFESGLMTDIENKIPCSGNRSVALGREMVVLYRKLGIVVSQKNGLVSYAGRAKGFSAYPDLKKFIFIITKNIFILKLEFFLPNFHSRSGKKWAIHPSTVSHLRRDELLSTTAASVTAIEVVHASRLKQVCNQ